VNFLSRYSEPFYALFRIISGLLFAGHGAMKLFGFLGGHKAGEALMKVAGTIEFFGGLLIALGLLTPIVAIIACGEMAVAYFTVHAKMPPSPFSPWENKGELAVLYCFIFLYIAAHGSGGWSVDSLRRKGRRG
jgi:putative oxidoreductase